MPSSSEEGRKCHPCVRNTLLPISQEGHEGLADVELLTPFRLLRLHPGIGCVPVPWPDAAIAHYSSDSPANSVGAFSCLTGEVSRRTTVVKGRRTTASRQQRTAGAPLRQRAATTSDPLLGKVEGF